jgi:hypothetical protein
MSNPKRISISSKAKYRRAARRRRRAKARILCAIDFEVRNPHLLDGEPLMVIHGGDLCDGEINPLDPGHDLGKAQDILREWNRLIAEAMSPARKP